ncbi:arginine--tRNA ligase [Agromyces archimandritae]|uniref:Arginine--tRNA ligase n=1 Tax=Agromyces archimandritae TaxID=2781962 RepID=A0A975FNL3_9MICO|nr:arginine--tRNA ligase [Agromyces archimandritae]QTX05172.1 arginine--tRNA ligase [Agromyces archimandritae]
MTPDDLSRALLDLVTALVARRRAGGAEVEIVLGEADIPLTRPKQREHGDWASNIAMRLAKPLGSNPREIATELAAGLAEVGGVASAEVAGPGFINVRLDAAAAGALAKTIVDAGAAFGRNATQAGASVNIEFVSANPTGPLHIAHTRWAAVGDAIARVLAFSGAEVAREYYINDAGAQMDRFGESIVASLQGREKPEGGYSGEYIDELGKRVLEARPDFLSLGEDEQVTVAREIAYPIQLDEIRASLDAFGVVFDGWFSERTLHAPGPDGGPSLIDQALDRLRAQGHVFEKDDAVWVRTTDFGDDKDRVIRRSNGEYTYFAADAAYYLSKSDRGFDVKVYLLGADHHGYINRLKAIAGAAGDDPKRNVEVLIGQMVSINGARLSKRAGNIIAMDDIVSWLGVDALRYSLERSPVDSPLDLDPEVLQRRTNDNPVFYVQYAHARTAAVARNAAAAGVDRSSFAPELLTHESESALLGALQEFPRVVAQAAELREPHRVARYIEELAGLFHRWYDTCRVLPFGDEPVGDLNRTRLWLNDATGQVIRNGLALLGVSAPERM